MEEEGRWVTKAEAVQEFEISLSTLDRRINAGEIEAVKRGRRVYVLMHGPKYMSDEELLRHSVIKLDECERTVRRLRQTIPELERERDEARDAATLREEAYKELEEVYRQKGARYDRMWRAAPILGLVSTTLLVLLVISILVSWRLLM